MRPRQRLIAKVHIPGLDGKTVSDTAKVAKKVVKKAAKKVAEQAGQAAAAGAAATTNAATSSAVTPDAAATIADAAANLTVNVSAVEVDQTPSAIAEFFSSLDPVLTAAVLGLLLLVAFYIYRTRFSATGQRGDTWLLVGPMGSGKTALFYRLKQGLFRPTQTSMKENDAVFVPQGLQDKISATRFVDLPGHASQRGKLDLYKPVAKGVIFVLDGSSPDTLGKVSQQLYPLLTDPVLQARRTPFFLAVNKAELVSSSSTASDETDDGASAAGGVESLARRLESLLDKTRSLQSTMSDIGSDGSDTKARRLGQEGKPFTFADSVCPISVGGVSAAKGDIDELMQFLQEH